MASTRSNDLTFHPLTPDRWDDFERLFGPSGAYGGCWCMWWRSTRSEFEQRRNVGNRRALKDLVQAGEVPGILAYRHGEAVAWCSVAPREQYGSLERSRVLRRVDERPVWSIVCFYIPRRHAGQGLMSALIRAAVDYVREQGGRIVEAYPTVPRRGRLPPVSSYMGIPAAFERAGFVQVARPSAAKVVLRYDLE
jgi:GNAT superfamily N-acetyltransferase